MKKIIYTNNTSENFMREIDEAICYAVTHATSLPESLKDIFTLEILIGYNPDGSNRGILNWA